MKKIIIMILIISILLVGCKTINYDACTLKDGRIVNTLSEVSCESNETNIGEIKGLRCPCICCVPQ